MLKFYYAKGSVSFAPHILLEDVIEILPKICMSGKDKMYNVGYGQNLKNREIVEKIKEITGCTYSVVKDAKEHSFPTISIQKIQNEFNFQPTSILTKLDDIIMALQKKQNLQLHMRELLVVRI